jgi:CBS domain-containing protein
VIVEDLMIRDIVAVQPDTSLADAAQAMLAHQIGGLPVLNDAGHLVGILTEGDLLRRPELGTSGRQANWLRGFVKSAALAAEYAHTNGRAVGDVMTRNPVFVRPETPLAKAAELMLQRRVKRLPVMHGEALVGMISRFDLLRALAPKLHHPSKDASDAEISAAIEQALSEQPWAPRSGLAIMVSANTVYVAGGIYSHEERRAILILASNIPGVKSVIDQMELVDARFRHAFPAD